ncbi:hypothetical protein LDHU3_30.4050:CDS1 [Leishmania donovani]|nr:hypothetical protein LDHU3_30.4050:CDS1 [Leishmania donovani]
MHTHPYPHVCTSMHTHTHNNAHLSLFRLPSSLIMLCAWAMVNERTQLPPMRNETSKTTARLSGICVAALLSRAPTHPLPMFIGLYVHLSVSSAPVPPPSLSLLVSLLPSSAAPPHRADLCAWGGGGKWKCARAQRTATTSTPNERNG